MLFRLKMSNNILSKRLVARDSPVLRFLLLQDGILVPVNFTIFISLHNIQYWVDNLQNVVCY